MNNIKQTDNSSNHSQKPYKELVIYISAMGMITLTLSYLGQQVLSYCTLNKLKNRRSVFFAFGSSIQDSLPLTSIYAYLLSLLLSIGHYLQYCFSLLVFGPNSIPMNWAIHSSITDFEGDENRQKRSNSGRNAYIYYLKNVYSKSGVYLGGI